MPGPLAAAALAGGAALASSAFNAFSDFNRNDTALKLSRTAHQREVADLKAAGLNPILSATGGRGAPMADLNAPHIDLGGAANTALAALQAKANIGLTMASMRKTEADADNSAVAARINQQMEEQDLNLRMATVRQQLATGDLRGIERDQAKAQLRILQYQAWAMKHDVPRQVSEEQFYKGFGGKAAPYLKVLGGGINSAKSVMEMFKK